MTVATTHENVVLPRREVALRRGRAAAVLGGEVGDEDEVLGGKSLQATTMTTVNEAVSSDILVVYNMYL